MNVKVFHLPALYASSGAPSRAWRISTDEGVFWLLQDGATARLLTLPLPGQHAARTTMRDDVSARGVALALEAETVAASRWVRQRTIFRGPDEPTATGPG
jgi:hypothetical protein